MKIAKCTVNYNITLLFTSYIFLKPPLSTHSTKEILSIVQIFG